MNYYQLLKVSSNASEEEIKAAYRKLAFQYHPDKNPGNPQAEEYFKLVNEAYRVLSNPEKRRYYDWQLLNNVFLTSFQEEHSYKSPRERDEERRRKARENFQEYTRRVSETPPTFSIQRINLVVVLSFAALMLLGLLFYFYMEKWAVETYTENAKNFYHQRQLEKAFNHVHWALRKDDQHPEANYLAGLLYAEYLQDYEKALYRISCAIQFAAKPPMRYFVKRAEYLYRLKRFEELEYDCKFIQKVFPNHRLVNFWQAEIYLYAQKEYQKAFDLYEKIATTDDSLRQQAVLGQAICLQRTKAYEASVPYFQKALLLNPEDGVTHYFMAFHFLEYVGDTLKACDWWTKAYKKGVEEARQAQRLFCETQP